MYMREKERCMISKNGTYLFDAIDAKFPPIISDSCTYTVTYEKYFNKYKYRYKTGSLKGLQVKPLKMTSILES